jgi:hypothetical protein
VEADEKTFLVVSGGAKATKAPRLQVKMAGDVVTSFEQDESLATFEGLWFPVKPSIAQQRTTHAAC